MRTITVNTNSKNYPVHIGNGIFNMLPEFVQIHKLPKRVFVIVDKKVFQFYGNAIKRIINSFAQKKYYLTLTSGEQIKSTKFIDQIFSKLYENRFGRDTLLISIGGGTIGDVSGFAASTYMRGVNLIHIPTTLLSAVDSSIGGKTGINFNQAKNLIGTFYQPDLVLLDTKFLESLPENEIISGYGEVIKYSYLSNQKFYTHLLSNSILPLKNNQKFLEKIIIESIRIKSSVVSSDEKEKTGVRKILNFGHTFAHAIESSTGYKISHGRAVIAGIIAALNLSFQKKFIDKKQLDYMLKLPLKLKPTARFRKVNLDDVFDSMKYDKKNQEGINEFVLIKNFGEILVDVVVDEKSIKNSINEMHQVWFKRATAGS